MTNQTYRLHVSKITPYYSITFLLLSLILCLSIPSFAAKPSSQEIDKQQFFTTSPDGAVKRVGQFSTSAEAYFHVVVTGNQKKAKDRNGDYVFQVTDPRGRLLLSTDPAECRIVRVRHGKIIALGKVNSNFSIDNRTENDYCNTQDSPDGVAGNTLHHDTNTSLYTGDPGLVIQLEPLLETPNPGHVYKLWLTPWSKYLEFEGNPFASPTPVCSTSQPVECESADSPIGFEADIGFSRHSDLRTHNFQIVPFVGNQIPSANAGPDQSVLLNSIVNLDGSGSSDPDGDPLNFNWSITQSPTGSTATLINPTSPNPSLTVDVLGSYEISLVVNDGTSNSAADSVIISTQNTNTLPVADAGVDQSGFVSDTITLDGSASSDTDGDPLTYQWQIISKPSTSNAQLSDTTTSGPSITLDVAGSYEIQLIVNDGQDDSAPDTVIVTTDNTAPIAEAGANQSAMISSVIQLNGSGSSDIDGDNLTYFWSFTSMPANSVATLSDAVAVMPTFTIDVSGSYTLQLIVNDGQIDSAADTVTISTDNTVPVANAGDNQSATINSLIQLDGSGSTDVDGDQLTYSWSLIQTPLGSNSALSDATAVMPSFTLDTPGDYVAQLIVNDGSSNSDPATVTIAFLNTAPIAEAGPAQSALIGSTIILDGSGSSDVDGDNLSYAWSFTDMPAGSTSSLLNESSNNPSFTIDVTGDYVIQLIVNDGSVDSIADTVIVSTDNSIPVANAGPNQDDAHTGINVTLDGSNSSDADGDPLNYLWSLLSKPEGSAAIISDVFASMPSLSVDLVGTYVAQLIVNDATADSLPDTVAIIASNVTPIADAGQDQRVATNETVTLDGSASSDGDNDTLSYSWQFTNVPNGSATNLQDSTTVAPSFTTDAVGDYVIELIVNDGTEDSVADTVTITSGNTLSLSLQDELVGVGRTTIATASLEDPAPAGGQIINLILDDPTLAQLNVSNLQFAEGETTLNFSITGLLPGLTTLTGSGDGVAETSAIIQVTQALVSIDQVQVVAPNEMTSVIISITEPAPPQGLVINLSLADPSIATLSTSSLFVPAGQFTPSSNAQITGVDFGETALSAVAVGYATDVRDVVVALEANFDPASATVTLPFTGTIRLQLDAPAPNGGVTFDVSADDDIISFASQANIPEGQTQSQPIELTGLRVGNTTLRANAQNFVETSAAITVNATEAYLIRGSSSRTSEAFIGLNLQDTFKISLGANPPGPVDVKVSVPENSGVLLSRISSQAGVESIDFNELTSFQTTNFYIQGTNIGDDVPLTIEIFEANTTNTLGYSIATTTVDVDPSGLSSPTRDITTTSFSNNSNMTVGTVILRDDESTQPEGSIWLSQALRGGIDVVVPMQSSNPNVVELPNGDVGDLTITGGLSTGSISIDPQIAGTSIVSIASFPGDFIEPINTNANNDSEVVVTVNAAQAYLSTSSSPISEILVGKDLQARGVIRLTQAPPEAIDVIVSVPLNSGVLLAQSPTELGSETLMLSNNASNAGGFFYIQGTALGDDVSFTIEVFKTGTSTPIGYDILPSTVDVDPSGLYLTTNDFTTTTFSNNSVIKPALVLLSDDESTQPIGSNRGGQQLRGGIDLVVPMVSSNPNVIALPNGAVGELTINGGVSLNSASITVDPQIAGTSVVSIASFPGDFTQPTNANIDSEVLVTVTAATASLTTSTNLHTPEVFVGKDLQVRGQIRLAQVPPSPVDIIVSVPLNSGVLLSQTAAEIGSDNLLLSSNSTSSSSGFFYIQGTTIGDDVPVTINVFETGTTNPIGYDILLSTVDVDPSGLYLTTRDITTTTFSNNFNLSASTVLLSDDENTQTIGSNRGGQQLRGGIDLVVPMQSSNPNVVTLPNGAIGELTINGGLATGTISVDPQIAGTSIVFISSFPGDFIEPTNANTDSEVLVTVTAPDTRLGTSVSSATSLVKIGDELQVKLWAGLQVPPPSGNPVDVTVEVISDTVAIVSEDPALEGSNTIVFSNVTSTSVGTLYLQGLSLNAATQVKISAPGYNDWITEVEVVDSGFRLSGTTTSLDAGQIRNLDITAYQLNPNTTIFTPRQIRGGASFDIDVTSSIPGVGSVTSPITISNGEVSDTTSFNAISSGTTIISIAQPPGFTPPAGQTSLEMTVN